MKFSLRKNFGRASRPCPPCVCHVSAMRPPCDYHVPPLCLPLSAVSATGPPCVRSLPAFVRGLLPHVSAVCLSYVRLCLVLCEAYMSALLRRASAMCRLFVRSLSTFVPIMVVPFLKGKRLAVISLGLASGLCPLLACGARPWHHFSPLRNPQHIFCPLVTFLAIHFNSPNAAFASAPCA